MIHNATFHPVLVAGGASRRMRGPDKRLLSGTDRQTLMQRAHRTLAQMATPVTWLVDAGFSLPVEPDALPVRDRTPGAGPLRPLLDWAGGHNREGWAIVLGTDLPNIESAILRRLLDLARVAGGHSAVVPSHHDQQQPLAAVYGVSFLCELADVLRGREDVRSFHAGLAEVSHCVVVAGPRELGLDPHRWDDMFLNVNTPEVWESWLNKQPLK